MAYIGGTRSVNGNKIWAVNFDSFFESFFQGSKDRFMINYENGLCPDTADLKASGPCHSSVPFKNHQFIKSETYENMIVGSNGS